MSALRDDIRLGDSQVEVLQTCYRHLHVGSTSGGQNGEAHPANEAPNVIGELELEESIPS
jgi:hypothetical protein